MPAMSLTRQAWATVQRTPVFAYEIDQSLYLYFNCFVLIRCDMRRHSEYEGKARPFGITALRPFPLLL
eukprot:IDg21401t1